MILVYITCSNRKEALKIANKLLEKKLIACANIFPSESIFRWCGKAQHIHEFILILKTKNNRFNQIKKEIIKIHSYKIPCILKIKTNAQTKFDKWVSKEVK